MKILKMKEEKVEIKEGLQDNPTFLRGRDMTAKILGNIPAKSNPKLMAVLFKREVVDFILREVYSDDPETKNVVKMHLIRELKMDL